MLDDALASVSIGSAEVDTVIDDQVIRPGELFSGEVVVQGGKSDQRIEGLEHRLTAATPDDDEQEQVVLNRWQVAEEFTVGEGERLTIPFEAYCHPEAPVTNLNCDQQNASVWIETGLAIDRAVDSSDTDYLQVTGTGPQVAVLEAMESLGLDFYRSTADSDFVTINGRTARVGFDQEFDFRPTRQYTGPEFDEIQLHIVPWPLENRTQVLLEVEESGLLGDEETFESMEIDHVLGYSTEGIARELREMLHEAD